MCLDPCRWRSKTAPGRACAMTLGNKGGEQGEELPTTFAPSGTLPDVASSFTCHLRYEHELQIPLHVDSETLNNRQWLYKWGRT